MFISSRVGNFFNFFFFKSNKKKSLIFFYLSNFFYLYDFFNIFIYCFVIFLNVLYFKSNIGYWIHNVYFMPYLSTYSSG